MKTAMRIEKRLTNTEYNTIKNSIRKECIVEETSKIDGLTHKTLRIYTTTDTNSITYVVGKLNELGIYNCDFTRISI